MAKLITLSGTYNSAIKLLSLILKIYFSVLARSLVYWLGQKAHVQEVVGSNPTVYWMDVSDACYYIFNEKGNKGSQMQHTKKLNISKISFSVCENIK
jgi:hypothetical protein